MNGKSICRSRQLTPRSGSESRAYLEHPTINATRSTPDEGPSKRTAGNASPTRLVRLSLEFSFAPPTLTRLDVNSPFYVSRSGTIQVPGRPSTPLFRALGRKMSIAEYLPGRALSAIFSAGFAGVFGAGGLALIAGAAGFAAGTSAAWARLAAAGGEGAGLAAFPAEGTAELGRLWLGRSCLVGSVLGRSGLGRSGDGRPGGRRPCCRTLDGLGRGWRRDGLAGRSDGESPRYGGWADARGRNRQSRKRGWGRGAARTA